MRLSRFATLSAAAALGLAISVTSASAQTLKKKRVAARDLTERITVVDETGRVRTRITVRPRSFLDPGTATKRYSESYTDYALPPDRYLGEYLVDRYDWKQSWSRMPFPDCVDLPNYCR